MRFYILGKKESENLKAVATVEYGESVAFQVVAESCGEATENVERMAAIHFPSLMKTKNVSIKISMAYLSEIDIPDHIFNQALDRLPGRMVGDKEIPPRISVPVELELAPIVGFGQEGYDLENLDVLKRRNLLSKDEVLALEEDEIVDAVFMEEDGQPLWKLKPRDSTRKAKYVSAYNSRRLAVQVPLK